MTRLDVRSLRIFTTVARCLSFTEAAAQLHMSQPPLSRAVRALEAALGAALFTRDTHHVALTKAGELLLPRAIRILREIAETETILRRHAGVKQGLRIGLTTSVEPGTFRHFAAALTARGPGVLTYATSPRLCALLSSGRLDAAVIALPTRTGNLSIVPLCRQPMVVAMPSTHRLAKRRRVALADLRHETVFWFERARQPAFFDHCQTIFAAHGFEPTRVREPADHHLLLASIAAGHGMAFLPRSFSALKLKGVAYRALREGDELAVNLAYVHAVDAGSTVVAASRLARRLVEAHFG